MSEHQPSGRTQLLSDAPVDEDAFEGGHDRVAEALASLIRDEEGGKAIALRGPYGSGKSTVIEILEDKIEDDGETRIFTYDAWEHQGDPLRRSFIESLVKFLKEVGWAEEKEWEDEIERIARRKEKNTLKTEPVLTKWGRRVVLALFLSPLGLAGFAVFIREIVSEVQADTPSVTAITVLSIFAVIWLILFLLPLALAYWARQSSGVETSGEASDEPDDGNDSGDVEELFYLFFKKTRRKTKTKTIRTPDPTTIEFQSIFEEILRQTLRDTERQLILVVDNLDRLPAEDAFSAWATMRTFFERPNDKNQDREDRFWLVVPFNFDALRSIFEDDKEVEVHEVEDQSSESPSDGEAEQTGDEGGNELEKDSSHSEERSDRSSSEDLQAFIDKTFTTTLRVAPPVFSDWKEFMKDQLREAFPNHGTKDEYQEDFHTIYQLYRIAGIGAEGIPTPRDIKLFINRLSVLYRQWGNQMPLPVLAAYTLKSNDISRDGHEIKDSDFLDRRIVDELQVDNWQEPFASLHFNVREGAIQVLIGQPVREALETGDAESLRRQADVTGFASVLDTVVPEIVQEGDASTCALTAVALDEIEIESGDTKRDVWGKLLRSLLTESNWYPASKNEGNGIVAILQNAPGARSRSTVEKLLASFSAIPSLDDGASWTNGVSPVIAHLKGSGYDDALRETLRVPGDGKDFVESMARLGNLDDGQDLVPFFVPEAKPEEIDQGLSQIIGENEMSPHYAEAVRLTTFVERNDSTVDWEWESTANALKQRIGHDSGASNEELEGLLKASLITANVQGDQSVSDFLSSDNGRANILHHYHQHKNDDELGIAALCVLLSLLHNPNVDRGDNSGNANQGQKSLNSTLNNPETHDDLMRDISRIMREFRIVRDVVESASGANKFQALTKHVLQDIAEKDDATQHITPDLLCEYPGIVVDALQDKGLASLVESQLSSGDLVVQLKEIEKEEWVQALNTESQLLDLVLRSLEISPSMELPSKFSDALLEHAENVLAGERSPTGGLRDDWHRLPEALSDSERKAFFQRIQRLLLDSSDGHTAQLIDLYEEPFFESGAIGSKEIENPNDVVNELLVNILSNGNEIELRWLEEVVDAHPELAEKTSDHFWSAFEKRIVEEIENQAGEPPNRLKNVAEIIGVDLPEEKELESSEDDQN